MSKLSIQKVVVGSSEYFQDLYIKIFHPKIYGEVLKVVNDLFFTFYASR